MSFLHQFHSYILVFIYIHLFRKQRISWCRKCHLDFFTMLLYSLCPAGYLCTTSLLYCDSCGFNWLMIWTRVCLEDLVFKSRGRKHHSLITGLATFLGLILASTQISLGTWIQLGCWTRRGTRTVSSLHDSLGSRLHGSSGIFWTKLLFSSRQVRSLLTNWQLDGAHTFLGFFLQEVSGEVFLTTFLSALLNWPFFTIVSIEILIVFNSCQSRSISSWADPLVGNIY